MNKYFLLLLILFSTYTFSNISPSTLIDAARQQVGVTRFYAPAYAKLEYPNGDIPRSEGVCTDVIIRAYRDAANFDLQQAVHIDMKQAFTQYPKNWGLKSTDRNIDHRRVPNLQTYFKRHNAEIKISQNPNDYQPGDIVTQMLTGNLPHILLVSDKRSTDGLRPLVIHNRGAGVQENDALFSDPITGHYRFNITTE